MDSTKGDSRGVIFTDLNDDGLPDLYIVNGPKGGQENELYMNDGNGSFEKQQNGLTSDTKATVGASFADVDNDGDLDGYLANWYDESNQFYVQEAGEWTSTSRRGINTRGNSESGAWGDYTGDGFVDLAVANGSLGSGQANFMTRYLDPALFEEAENIMTGDRVNSRSLNWVDVDRDNDLDLFIGEENAPNKIYFNIGGDFVLDSLSDFVNASDVTFGSSMDDIDNDGDLDLVVANWGRANFTYANNSQGVFSSLGTAGTSGYSIGSSFGDYDNDGDLDLVIVNGFVPDGIGPETNGLYLNDGNGNFSLSSEDPISKSEGNSYGVANADYDRDGYLDVSIANIKGNISTYADLGVNQDYFMLKGPNSPYRIDLINMEGKILESWNQIDRQFSLAQFDSGFYLLRIWTTESNFTLPLVKR
ncbi:unnamed protein product [Symbiodinium microadriaticum]|nr:unnamed protein product [Symbiodinium microadriaticum]